MCDTFNNEWRGRDVRLRMCVVRPYTSAKETNMKRAMCFEVYEGLDGWRWRLRAANGEIVADSAEAYTRKSKAHRAVELLQGNVHHAAVKELQSVLLQQEVEEKEAGSD